jgi:hypothetical protein
VHSIGHLALRIQRWLSQQGQGTENTEQTVSQISRSNNCSTEKPHLKWGDGRICESSMTVKWWANQNIELTLKGLPNLTKIPKCHHHLTADQELIQNIGVKG